MRVGRWHVTLCAVAVLVAAPAIGAAPVAQGPRSPATVTVAAFPISATAGDYDLYDFVVDFPPGSATPRHVHGGPVVVTVVAGQLVLQRAGSERVIKTGESFLEMPGDVHALVNRSTTSARISAAELIPKGAEETTVVK
ncbi:MAG TPA: cupin domain-containing protein [bacterium]|nr:cupin domain-containing protein [bacterium]